MFPETFAEEWIDRLTQPGDIVLDPFCGRGTAPFQALLMGRQSIANDINPVAYCVTRAKSRAPSRGAVLRRITRLQGEAPSADEQLVELPVFFRHAYHRATLSQ